MTHRFTILHSGLAALTLALSLSLGITASPAYANSNDSSVAKKPMKQKKAKGKKSGGVTFYEGSGETRTERERRLLRECKGRPNAGLCEGYARP